VVADPQTLQPVPGVAKSWESSQDGKVWTFHLRADARYSNGDRVRAQDFVASWLRMIDPANGAEYSFFYDVIKGAHAYRTGSNKDSSSIGITAVNDGELKVELEDPAAHFLKLLTHISFLPLHPGLLKSTGWANASTIIGNGPFVMKSRSDTEIYLEKNAKYWDAENVAVDKLRIRFIGDANDATDGYRTGKIQWVTRSLINVDKLQSTDKLEVNPMFGTTYFFFNCGEPVWSDWRVRRGLALLVPWDKVRSKDDFVFPSDLLVPSIPNYPVVKGIADQQVAEAKKLLADAGYPEGRGLPPLIVKVSSESQSTKAIVQKMADAWKALIGLTVVVKAVDANAYLAETRKNDFALAESTWIGDYADPLTFLQLWTTGSNLNDARFSDKDYDTAVNESISMTDTGMRYRRLADAEQILLTMAAVLPLDHSPAINLINTNSIGGWYANPLDVHPFKSIKLNAAPWGAVPLNEAPKEQPPQKSAAPLELKELSFDDVYPVFRTYYDTHPLGKVVLRNITGQLITDIRVSFQIKEFMSDPKDCAAPSELAPGESCSVDLFGLFLPTILQTTEETKTQARVDVDYTYDGQVQHQSLVQSIPILDRNATTWSDDRRAAAFVTTKDPVVVAFSKNVNSVVKRKTPGVVNPNLLTAIALFQTLQLFGLTYSQDPIPTLTANKQVADYIQFPRQTLQYKGGKCSDFSVLYSALLESVGIETAFITIPRHIFIAFSTGGTPDEARRSFSRTDDLIFRNEKCWIPVEVTESAGFMQAWQDGASEWRENLSRNQADFYPLHDAWQLYEPVALPGAEVMVTLPSSEKIVGAYQSETGKFIDQEILPKVAALRSQISKAQDPRKPTNALGVLYARYGQYDRAQKEFKKLLSKEDYVPALLNMGNILYVSDQKEKAMDYYDRAYVKEPENPRVLLAVAKVNHDLENYFAAKKFYAELKTRDPDLAMKFAYLDLKGEEAARSAEVSGMAGTVVWQE
jgi:ABC-type oligopeptide transport system substrate-binding subunit/tetratricopeptide (TPR) repeat protein